MKERISNYVKKITGLNELQLTNPENESFGHYSTNAAFSLAKDERKSPFEVAQKLAERIKSGDSRSYFKKIEAVQPGFINFWLNEAVLTDELKTLLKAKEKYGKPLVKAPSLRNATAGKQGKKIQVEFISANPTGPLTMANGRGGFLGDALANVLEWAGNKVEREYYVNDTGNQILTLGKSMLASLGLVLDEEKFYKAEYIKEWAKKHAALVKKNQKNPLKIGQLAAKDFLSDIKKAIEKKAGIHFTRYTSEEKDIHKKGFVKKALAILKKAGTTYESEGALWLKTTDFGDDKDRVLMTRDGFPTYFLADAGHYLETKTRKFKKKINIFGPDHYGYVARIQAVAQILGVNDSQIIMTQAVRVVQNGVEVKMSKRKGSFVTFEEVVEEVGADAARFFFLMHTPNTHMDFDLELAKERSMKNPVYYVQYAFVRCLGILRKVKSKSIKVKSTDINFQLLNTKEDMRLIFELLKFPDTINRIGGDFEVSRLVRYAMSLAGHFHNFYEKEHIIGEKENVALARLELVKATQIVLKMTLVLLGVKTPKKM